MTPSSPLSKRSNKKALFIAHIILLCVGGVFLLSCNLHQNIWFDESYSVALARTGFLDLIRDATEDVHPLLYYILLKLWSLIAGTSIVSLRIFSVIGAQALAILGITHIRRDFGAWTGFWYSFIIYALPTTVRYAGEIRMYSWLPFFATLTAIYAYRLYRTQKLKDYILFVLMSLCTAYTHYFGLVFVFIVNAMLLIAIFIGRKKKIPYLLAALSQLVLYIPGFYVLWKQLQSVGSGFWIHITYPNVLLDTLAFFFVGDTPDGNTIFPITQTARLLCTILGGIVFAVILAVMIILYIQSKKQKATKAPNLTEEKQIPTNDQTEIDKNKNDLTAMILAFSLCIFVVATGLLASAIMPKSDIYYVRYIMVFLGLFAFVLASLISKIRFSIIQGIIAIFLVTLLIARTIPLYQTVYNKECDALEQFVEQNIGEDDLVAGADIVLLGIYAEKITDRQVYLCTQDQWYGENHFIAFACYQPQLNFAKDIRDLPIQSGQTIWVLDNDQLTLTQKLMQAFDLSYLRDPQTIYLPYHSLHLTMVPLQAHS